MTISSPTSKDSEVKELAKFTLLISTIGIEVQDFVTLRSMVFSLFESIATSYNS